MRVSMYEILYMPDIPADRKGVDVGVQLADRISDLAVSLCIEQFDGTVRIRDRGGASVTRERHFGRIVLIEICLLKRR